MKRRVTFLTILALATTVWTTAPRRAEAYQIDCAILLCLAGGFPPSEPCARARAEMIRRITPWPIEPPLRLWRCPMRAGFMGPGMRPGIGTVTEAYFIPIPVPLVDGAPDPVPKVWQAFGEDVTDYVMAIKVYDMT